MLDGLIKICQTFPFSTQLIRTLGAASFSQLNSSPFSRGLKKVELAPLMKNGKQKLHRQELGRAAQLGEEIMQIALELSLS